MPKAKKTKSKQQSRLSFLRGKSKLRPLLFLLLIALAGTFALFYANAATDTPYRCHQDTTPNTSQKVCDVREALSPNNVTNMDSILSVGKEYDTKVAQGWRGYGTKFRAPTYQAAGSVPVIRTYSSKYNKHIWYSNETDANNAVKYFGFTIESRGEFYVWKTQVAGTVPVYAFDNPTRQLFYYITGDLETLKADYAKYGWTNPVIAFYAYPASYIPPAYVAPTTTDNSSKPCREQNLQQGSSGECVKFMKGMLNYIYQGSLTVDTNFDAKTANIMTIYAADKGITTYKGVITASVWDHIVRTFEATQKSRNAEIAATADNNVSKIAPSSAPASGDSGTSYPCPNNQDEFAAAKERDPSFSDLTQECREKLFALLASIEKAKIEQVANHAAEGINDPSTRPDLKGVLGNIAEAYRIAYETAQKGEVRGDNAISPAWTDTIYSYKVENVTGFNAQYALGSVILSKGSRTLSGNLKLGYCNVNLYYAKVYPSPLYWTYPDSACHYNPSAYKYGVGRAQATNLGMKASTISNLLRAKASDRAIRFSLP